MSVILETNDKHNRPWPPYHGIPTLLDAPYRDMRDASTLAGLDIALIGVPFDGGVTNRPGACFGPRALRCIERVGPYHHTLKLNPFETRRIADIGDVSFPDRYSLKKSLEAIEHFYRRVCDADARPLSVGGDHSVTFPILKALQRSNRPPVGVVHIDAHCDTGEALGGEEFHHGAPFRQATLAGVLDPKRTIQIGIRGSSKRFWQFSYDHGMRVVHMEEFEGLGAEKVADLARSVVGSGPVYISFDVDGLDPAFAPGTGTPEVGGLSTREAQQILRGLKGLNVVGGDVVEVAPQYDTSDTTAQVGAQMLFEILCLMTCGDVA